jgi:dihydrofolate reductase
VRITLVAAVARNGVIGAAGGLPWHLPGDLRHFKELTLGHPMVMGRRTFDAIGRALPGRRTIVVTRDINWRAADVEVVHSLEEALQLAGSGSAGPVLVVGGGEVYRQALPLADRLEITEVHADAVGDTHFPAIDRARWIQTRRERHEGYDFVRYERRGPERDLSTLISTLRPERVPGVYVFCSVMDETSLPSGTRPAVAVREPEGLTVVVPVPDAIAAGLDGRFECAWIRISATSALDAVGLTAAMAAALTADGIACNVVAGFHHDHLFVPVDRVQDALAALNALRHTRS